MKRLVTITLLVFLAAVVLISLTFIVGRRRQRDEWSDQLCLVNSDHQKYAVGSPDLEKYMDTAFQELRDFNEYAVGEGITYSLAYGSALGYLMIRTNMPWDDDIDVHVKSSDWSKIEALWNTAATPPRRTPQNPDAWEFVRIKLNKKPYILARGSKPMFYKLIIPVPEDDWMSRKDEGGLDLFPEGWDEEDPRMHGDLTSPPISVTFGGVDTFISSGRKLIENLISLYGPIDSWGMHMNCFTDVQKKMRSENIAELKKTYNL